MLRRPFPGQSGEESNAADIFLVSQFGTWSSRIFEHFRTRLDLIIIGANGVGQYGYT